MKKDTPYIGCSSYATPSWKALFYPNDLPKKDWFNYYSRHFDTYEFNGSFYKFPTVENLLTWYNKVPANFKFSLKAPRIITHVRRLEQCNDEIIAFYEISKEGLKDKLACILWQLPPSFNYSEDKLQSILHAMNPDFKNVVEFRHESWWREDVVNILQKNNVTFCNVNYPKLPTSIQQTTAIGYFRMHGNPQLFYSEYGKKEIETLYNEVQSVGFNEVYIYFNNTASTAAIINALQLKEISEKKAKTD